MKCIYLIIFVLINLIFLGCTNDEYEALVNRDQEKPCSLILFSDKNFTGEKMELRGSRTYSNLDDLSGSHGKVWTEKAQSFTVGQDATVTIWPHRNYRGDSIVYKGGKYSSVIEPGSLRIFCDEE